jgi:hypothetical protein
MRLCIPNLYSYNSVEIWNCVCDAYIMSEVCNHDVEGAPYLELRS